MMVSGSSPTIRPNGRIAVIDLRDFETKQIINNPLYLNDHGGTFVTPNTDYIIEGGQYAQPLGTDFAPLSDYRKHLSRHDYLLEI